MTCERKTIPTKIPLRFNPRIKESKVIFKLPIVNITFPYGESKAKKVTVRVTKIDGKIFIFLRFMEAIMKNKITKSQRIIVASIL